MNHSEKGIKTIKIMNTRSKDWGLTPIKWTREWTIMPVVEKCPDCDGRGEADFFKATGKLAKNPYDSKKEYFKWNEWLREIRMTGERKQCPTCPKKRTSWGDIGTGEVTVYKKIKVWVGRPVWAKGTKFDSRFANQWRDAKVCELCSKSITGRWSNLVPVNAKAKGVIHGMWVGEDCARKFFGLELVLSPDQFKGIKKSEIKRHYRIIDGMKLKDPTPPTDR